LADRWQAAAMSNVPASSNVMLACLMLAFFSLCLVITFESPPIWWAIPAAFTLVLAGIATVRIRQRRRMRRALQGADR
jgi:membrane protein YdbS with pleckstrin-like domain